MSFSLAVWSSSKPIASEQAGHIYEQLGESGGSPSLTPQADAQKRVGAFLQALERKYPAISSDKWTDETIDDCPWSSGFDVGAVYVFMDCVWSWADHIASFVAELAYRHDLVYYDPQSERVQMPASLGGVHPEPAAGERPLTAAQIRQAKKEAQQAITEVIDRAISALGFEKKPWPGVRGPGQGLYIRQINPETLGLVRWYDLSGSGCNIPDVTVWIGVRSQPLEKALAEERGEKFHPYWGPSMEVEIGTLMGITQRWYKFKEVEKDAEVAEQIAAEVRDYAIPFMEAHASLAALATKAGQPCFYWERPKEERARIAHLLMATDERAPQV